VTFTPRRAHRATTATLRAINPHVSEGGLSVPGVYIGRNVLGGGPFEFDPWELIAARCISGPNMIVIGEIGYAKSALVKTWLDRRLVYVDPLGRGRVARVRVRVIDPKGEYDVLAAAWGVTPVRFRSGGGLRINPLDPMMGDKEQVALLRAIAGTLLGRELRSAEAVGLQQAHGQAVLAARSRLAVPVLPDVTSALLDPSAAVVAELGGPGTTAVRIAEDNRELALALMRLTIGDLGGMFDGPTSPALNLSGQRVIYNVRDVDDMARPILMACMSAWLRSDWTRDDRVDKDILVTDEAWATFRHLAILRWLQDSNKHARLYGVTNVFVTHRLSDLTAAGDDGSEKVKLAEGLLADTQVRVIYRQTPGEVEVSADLLGLSGPERDIITRLPKGMALWKIGGRSFLVQHMLSERDERLVYTDEALRLRDSDDLDDVASEDAPTAEVGGSGLPETNGVVAERAPWIQARPETWLDLEEADQAVGGVR
jgi:hypothetical protein